MSSGAPVHAFGWPTPRQGPQTRNEYETNSNPVLRGWTLATITTIIKSSSWISGILWRMNKFDQLKLIPELSTHEPRYDPTVVSTEHNSETHTVADLKVPPGRQLESSYYTVGDYYAEYQSGRITPTDVAQFILQNIQEHEKARQGRYSQAYLEIKHELVLAAAKASTERWAQGKPLSPIDGVPIAVKDEIELAGYSRSLGSGLDMASSDNATGWCVRKWEEAGAVIIGKTNMHQFGLDTNGNNPWTGTPRMPHNEDYYPGGSSSGSAVTIAQGICPIALGADGGGSIRIPASFCGIYGLKPSHGRVSSRPTKDLAYSVGVYGPMASDIESLEIAYRIMAQPDLEHYKSRAFPDPLRSNFDSARLVGKTIGICREWIARSDPDVLAMFNEAVDYYTKVHGYQIVDIDLPYLIEGKKAHGITILTEIRAGLSGAQISKLSYPNQLLLTVAGTHATAQDLLAAQRIRTVMMEHLSWLWEQHPDMLILTPTIPHAGWKIEYHSDVTDGYGVSDGNKSLQTMEYSYLANWTGCPAISRPMGYAVGNLPAGLMAMGPWGSEEQLIGWAKQGEGMLTNGSARRPAEDSVWVDVLQGIET